MRTDQTRRTKRQIINTQATQQSCHECACTHYHAVVCQSKQTNSTLANTILCAEKCYCLCHLDSDGKQVSQSTWECIKAQQGRESA